MRNLISALLWDLDGTIIDTREVHFLAWKRTLNQYGFDLKQNTFEENLGRNNRISVPLFLGFEPSPELYDQLVEEKEALFRQVAPKQALLVPGVESWLADAQNAHIVQVVASSASMENIVSLIEGFELSQYFMQFISGANMPAKPAPDVFLEASKILNLPFDQCCVVEDSLAGVQAAKNAGMTCIAVTTTLNKAALHLADYVVEDFTKPLSLVLFELGLLMD